MFGLNKKTIIKLEEFPGIDFFPFHQLKKENDNNEPYLKSIKVGSYQFDFFKIKGITYVIKPTDQKNLTKMLACKVTNPITIESAVASITGNCARGITKEFTNFYARILEKYDNENDVFIHLIS
jgi:hypothetical protein